MLSFLGIFMASNELFLRSFRLVNEGITLDQDDQCNKVLLKQQYRPAWKMFEDKITDFSKGV